MPQRNQLEISSINEIDRWFLTFEGEDVILHKGYSANPETAALDRCLRIPVTTFENIIRVYGVYAEKVRK